MRDPFVRTFPVITAGNDVTRQVLSDSPELMVVRFTFATGGTGALHRHPHVQATFVQSGRFTFTIAGDSFEVGSVPPPQGSLRHPRRLI